MNTYADDLAALTEKLDLKKAIDVGHSTGGGEVARYIGRHGPNVSPWPCLWVRCITAHRQEVKRFPPRESTNRETSRLHFSADASACGTFRRRQKNRYSGTHSRTLSIIKTSGANKGYFVPGGRQRKTVVWRIISASCEQALMFSRALGKEHQEKICSHQPRLLAVHRVSPMPFEVNAVYLAPNGRKYQRNSTNASMANIGRGLYFPSKLRRASEMVNCPETRWNRCSLLTVAGSSGSTLIHPHWSSIPAGHSPIFGPLQTETPLRCVSMILRQFYPSFFSLWSTRPWTG